MKQNQPIAIRRVGNGWLIEPNTRFDGHPAEELMVFETFAAMISFLVRHFEEKKT
jgi:hypothetical protein